MSMQHVRSLVTQLASLIMLVGVVLLPWSSVRAVTAMTYLIDEANASAYEFTGTVVREMGAKNNWYAPQWSHRLRIVINHDLVGEDLTDFPIVLRLDDLALGEAREDRHDLIVTAADGVTKLSHEREDRNTLWVKIPTLSANSDTVLYLYYGNPQAADQQNVRDVWSNGFVFVYHMNKDPAVVTSESAESGVTFSGTSPMNANDSLREGKMGRGLYFKDAGTETYLDLGRPSVLDLRDKLTLSAWVNTDDATQNDNQQIISAYDGSSTSDDTFYFSLREADVRYSLRNPAGSAWATSVAPIRNVSSSETTQSNVWYHAFGTFDGSSVRAYVNGVGGSATAKTDQIKSLTRDIHIGDRNEFYDSAIDFQGRIDEVRIANVGRSAAWVKTEYLSQCNCENFLTIADQPEVVGGVFSGADTESTVQLKPDHPLYFTSLSSFVPNASGQVTYQLSNDGGTTWLFYTSNGWKPANPSNSNHRSSAQDIHAHVDTFPLGEGRLVWKAFLPAGASLDSLKIDYEPNSAVVNAVGQSALPVTSLQDYRVQAINALFRSAFGENISPSAWTHWVTRMMSEPKRLDEWLGAMQWQALYSQ